jgi:ribosomal protein S18 acetylase RimI-like enzyme
LVVDSGATQDKKEDVIIVKGDEGALSLEFIELRDGVARAFPRWSPRGLRLSESSGKRLSAELSSRSYSRILVQDNKKGLLRRTLSSEGWEVGRAIEPKLKHSCSAVTTYDIPVDKLLQDASGQKPDISNTSHMSGVSLDLGDRKAWAFFTDDGETARIVSEGERKQGMLVASSHEDLTVAADCLVQYLATMKKSWAVFSTDMGRFIRKFDPMTMWRLVLDRPTGHEHRGLPASGASRSALVKLFSEYYDEPTMHSLFRLRRFKIDRNYAVYYIDGGFVITRLDGDTGLIYDIYVTPSRQGEGIGDELMRCGITDLAGKVSSCYLHTSYPRAKRLYEKFGFKTVYSQLGIRLDEISLKPPSAR